LTIGYDPGAGTEDVCSLSRKARQCLPAAIHGKKSREL